VTESMTARRFQHVCRDFRWKRRSAVLGGTCLLQEHLRRLLGGMVGAELLSVSVISEGFQIPRHHLRAEGLQIPFSGADTFEQLVNQLVTRDSESLKSLGLRLKIKLARLSGENFSARIFKEQAVCRLRVSNPIVVQDFVV